MVTCHCVLSGDLPGGVVSVSGGDVCCQDTFQVVSWLCRVVTCHCVLSGDLPGCVVSVSGGDVSICVVRRPSRWCRVCVGW